MKNTSVILLLIAVIVVGADAAELPRIAARPKHPVAEFYVTTTGSRFTPQGNNHVYVLGQRHALFDPEYYQPAAEEAVLTQMAGDGYNVVRVFIDPFSVGTPGCSRQLSPEYMANVLDFLQRARAHSLYVIVVLNYHPFTCYYAQFAQQRPDLEFPNVFFLDAGHFEAKKEYARQFVSEIRNFDSSLLTTVFSFEADNEPHLNNAVLPFSRTSGTVTTAAGVCDLSTATSRQACMDDNLVLWAEGIAAAVRSEDSQAMVSASVYSYGAVGKPGPAGLLPLVADAQHAQFPARPKVLLERTSLSYVDFHASPPSTSWSMHLDLESSELHRMDLSRRPLLLGEFAALKTVYAGDVTRAAYAMREHRANAYDLGFAGSLFWTWEPYADDRFYAVTDSGGAINGVLAPIVPFTAPRADYRLGHWDGDAIPDLIRITHNATNTQKAELSIASGVTNYQTVVLTVPLPFPAGDDWEFEVADWDGDRRSDLFGIRKRNTGSGSTEVLIVTAASRYQKFAAQVPSAFPMGSDDVDFELANWDSDALLDLVAIRRSGNASGRVEVAIASGASQFRTVANLGATVFPAAGAEMDFEVADWNADGIPDLVGVRKFATGTFRTELHVAAGNRRSGFDRYVLNAATILPHASGTTDYELALDGTRTPYLVGIRKAFTASLRTELRWCRPQDCSTIQTHRSAFGEAR